MNIGKSIFGVVALTLAAAAAAAPSAEEVKRLGTTLTPWGAEKSGNKDGTIPEYTGGVKNPPKVDYKTGILPNPYADDKVLFWIDANNLDKYADKVSPGVQAMIKKSPKTMRLAIYPTHRSASYPQNVLDDSIKNATRCGTKDGISLDASKGCRGGFAFPIPKDGAEAMWDHFTAYWGPARIRKQESRMVKPNGEVVLVNAIYAYEDNQLYDPDTTRPTRHYGIRTEYFGPTRLVGNSTVIYDSLENVRSSWSYQTASRRTRLAPDYAGDMPIATTGGSMMYDQINIFQGPLDQFDWKLVGKQEMYIPYNNYGLGNRDAPKECDPDNGLLLPNHPNPNCIRWELHRVWHIKGTVKAGKRHVFGSRDIYFDEDTWLGGVADAADHSGKLYIVQWTMFRPDYVKNAPMVNSDHANFDLNSGLYHFPVGRQAWSLDKPMPILVPDAMQNFVLKNPSGG